MHLRSLLCAVIGLLTVTLSGCSMPRLAYTQADWLLLRKVDNFLDLRDNQREQLATTLGELMSRHRREQLPAVVSSLREAGARAQRTITLGDAQWMQRQGMKILHDSIEMMLPTLAHVLTNLDAQQRTHLAERLREHNDEYAKSRGLKDDAQSRARRTSERTIEQIERWTGPLSETQLVLVEQSSRVLPEIAGDWAHWTREQQQGLLALLNANASPAMVEQWLRDWWIRRATLPGTLVQRREQRTQARVTLIVRLDATLDSVQREHLVRKLQSLSDDARSLLVTALSPSGEESAIAAVFYAVSSGWRDPPHPQA